MPLSLKTTQIQSVISQVKEELERHCFWHLTQHGQGFLIMAFDAAWAGVSYYKISALKNI
jgi:hypothetical protein